VIWVRAMLTHARRSRPIRFTKGDDRQINTMLTGIRKSSKPRGRAW